MCPPPALHPLPVSWVLFTRPLLDRYLTRDTRQWRKQTLTGRIKESRSFSQNPAGTWNVTLFLPFLRFYTCWCIFLSVFPSVDVSFFPLYFSSFQSCLGLGCMKSSVSLSGSGSEPACFESRCPRMCPRLLFLLSCGESLTLSVHIIPVLHFSPSAHPSSRQPHKTRLPVSSRYHRSKWALYRVANFLFHHSPNTFWHRLSLHCRLFAETAVLYCNKAMQHSGQVLPLVDVCPQLASTEGGTSFFHSVFYIVLSQTAPIMQCIIIAERIRHYSERFSF